MGFSANAGEGTLNPHEYEYQAGSSVTFTGLLLLPDDDDRLLVWTDKENASELTGLWLKVSDGMAVEFGEPDSSGPRADEWIFDVGEGSLAWFEDDEIEVSLWDSQPPGTELPTLPFWSGTLTVRQETFGNLGIALGYSEGGFGLVDPLEYEYEPGQTGTFTTVVLLTDTDRLHVTAAGPTPGSSSGLEGQWLRLGAGLAVEFGASQGTTDSGNESWFFDIPGGLLDWSSGDEIQLSLWDEQPPGTELPPQRLWSATLTAAAEDYGSGLGNGVGFGKDVEGFLDPEEYEYEPGSTAAFYRILLLTDNADRLYVGVYNDGAPGVDGLWLKVSDSLAFEFGEPSSTGSTTTRWFFDIGDGVLDWSSGDEIQVSLWDRDPTGG